jgi:predicted kinase
MPDLIVIVGPIASGKTTIAAGLARRLRSPNRPVAVLDLDDVVDAIGGFAGLRAERFRQAQLVHGQLVGAWLGQGIDVIAHGPFFQREEDEALLHAVPSGTGSTGVALRRVQLLCTYEAALARTAADADRLLSKDPVLLRRTYDRVESLLPTLPPSDWTFDTTALSASDIVDALAARLG